MAARPQKITFGEMRSGRGGVRGLLVYCADYRCGHHVTLAQAAEIHLPEMRPARRRRAVRF